MPWLRQLPSGLWAATIYTIPADPASRLTKTDPQKDVVKDWALDREAEIRRGDFINPKLAATQLGEVWRKFGGARRLEKASRARDLSTWKCHVEPRWGKIPVGAILKPEVQEWINGMEAAHADSCRSKSCTGCRHGGWTIIAALNVVKAALELAVDAGFLRSNPARRVRAPIPPAHVDRVIDSDEERLILARCDTLFPGRRDARPFIEGLFESGCRWEEWAAVKKEAFNLRAGLVSIGPVMERDGSIRDYPKGARSRQSAGFRNVALGEEYLARVKPLVLATKPGGVVFTAPKGGHLLYPTWLDRVWNVVIGGVPERVLNRAPAGAYDAAVFGDWLDGQKARLDLASDADLARAVGVRRSMIANWRADRFGPGRSTADRLAGGLKVKPAQVYAVTGLLVPGIAPAGLVEPWPTPHDTRHSFGTRLAEGGVEMHDRMALMGHKDVRSGQRYTHSGESRYDRARAALKAARG